MSSKNRERIGRPLLSDFQNCALSPGRPSQDPSVSHPAPPQSRKTSSSHFPSPDALGWIKTPILLGLLISHWQPPGKGDSLAKVGAVVREMGFHRLNLGFLLPKGLRETNRKMAKRGEVRLTQRLAGRGQGRGIQ